MIRFSKYVSSTTFILITGFFAATQSFAQEDKQTQQPVSADYRAYVDTSGCTPIWPKASIRNEETGAVTLAFLVDAEGILRDSKIVRSSGFRDLDNVAHSALRGCTFHPATENGKPVKSWMNFVWVWKIEQATTRF